MIQTQTPTHISPNTHIMQQFYKSMQEWIDAGTPQYSEKHHFFNVDVGLCSNLTAFLISIPAIDDDAVEFYAEQLENQLKLAGLALLFPFNQQTCYHTEKANGTIYQNPERLEWIRKHSTQF